MVNEVDLNRWKYQVELRGLWADFKRTEAFRIGLELIRDRLEPRLVMGETMEQAALRQAFQAGVYSALNLVNNADRMHSKEFRAALKEWGHVTPPTPEDQT